ncbi:MAG: CCA tRNA nucleotidyltransferase [Verrucomicrobia bacterium]|nr:CCA tRNA nucleotidyltransferase [Verrucomicrobiota bacterium]
MEEDRTEERSRRRRDVAIAIVARLQQCGYTAFFAGGCVRDALRGVSPKDIDIVTAAEPKIVQGLFSRTVPVGAQFGVIRVLEQGFEFEVATFRADGKYVDGRRPESVVFSTPREDAERRDFTVNGMFLNPVTGQVIDYVGGREDLARRLIRAIGRPAERFLEDRLRLLRAVRFATTLQFEIEPATWEALQEQAAEITVVSAERIRDELNKVFLDPNRVAGLDRLESAGLLQVILPEVQAMRGCEQPPQFHPEGDVYVHTRLMLSLLSPDAPLTLVWAVLLHDIGKPVTKTFHPEEGGRIRFNGHDRVGAEMAEDIMTRLRFSNEEISAVAEAVRNHMVFKDAPQMRPARLRRFMARPTFPVELELHRADCAGSHGDLGVYDFLEQKREEFAAEPLIPKPLITGHDLIAMGLTPGPRFREILDAVQTSQLEGDTRTKADALALVEKLL